MAGVRLAGAIAKTALAGVSLALPPRKKPVAQENSGKMLAGFLIDQLLG
jgi:hypothetical protein